MARGHAPTEPGSRAKQTTRITIREDRTTRMAVLPRVFLRKKENLLIGSPGPFFADLATLLFLLIR